MTGRLTLVAAVLVTAVASSAPAATTTLAITPNGYVPKTVTLNANPALVVFGGVSTLSGQLATGQGNQKIDIMALECGGQLAKLMTVTTTGGGAYGSTVQPLRNTTYESRFKSSISAQVLVKVRAKVTLRRLAPRRFRVTVVAGDSYSYAGRSVLFQRYNVAAGRWVTVRSALLRAAAPLTGPVPPNSVSTSTFRASVKAGLRVRAYLTQTQAGTCYVGGPSRTIRS